MAMVMVLASLEDDDNDANYADGHFQVVGQFKTSTVKGPKIH